MKFVQSNYKVLVKHSVKELTVFLENGCSLIGK